MNVSRLLLFACALSWTCEAYSAEWLEFPGHGTHAEYHIVLISGDEEYRSEEALPQLARILSLGHGFRTTVLFAQDPADPGIVNPTVSNNIPGLQHLDTADLMVIFTRFRALRDEQMKRIDEYLLAGRPVVGIRTATHAFAFARSAPDSPWRHYGNEYEGNETGHWEGGFGRLVLGEKWIAHHGEHKHQSTRGVIAPGAEAHPITNGLRDGDVWGATDVYRVRLPLPGDANPVLLGQVVNRKATFDPADLRFGMRETDRTLALSDAAGVSVNDPLMPIAWTKTYSLPGGTSGRAFTSTIGSSTDMLSEGVRRLLVNGIYWALDLPVPDKAGVAIVGDFRPSQFGFLSPDEWVKRRVRVSELD